MTEHKPRRKRNRCKVWSYDSTVNKYSGIANESLRNLTKGPAALRAQAALRRQELGGRAMALFFDGGRSKAEVARLLGIDTKLLNRCLGEYRVLNEPTDDDPLLD